MAARISKSVTDLSREGSFVLSAFHAEGDQIAEILTGLTRPNLGENDPLPGYGSVFYGMSRNIQGSLDRLVEADVRLTDAVGWESSLRKEHFEKSQEQGFILVSLRQTVVGQYVEPDLDNLALYPVDVRDAVTVARRSEMVSVRFGAPNLTQLLGKSRFDTPVDFTPYLTQLRESARALVELGKEIHEAERATARARMEKTRLQKEHEKLVLRSARVFEDFCRLAGDDELADKIRRTVRSRPSGQEPGEDEPGEDGPDDVVDPIADVEVSSEEGEAASQEV